MQIPHQAIRVGMEPVTRFSTTPPTVNDHPQRGIRQNLSSRLLSGVEGGL